MIYNPTLYITWLNFAIIILLAIVGVVCQNPLVVLGLLLLRDTPLLTPGDAAEQYEQEGETEEDGDETLYGEHRAGFLREEDVVPLERKEA